jgi:hypothetical protein
MFMLMHLRLTYCNGFAQSFASNSTVNTNTGNNRKETVFYAVRAGRKHGAVGSLLPGNEAVNMHPQQ